MNENQMIAVVTEATAEALKERSKEIYDDGLKPATREAGEALQTIVGLFNNVILYPVKKANITFKYKLEEFEQDLRTKVDKIPNEKIIEPPLTIAGPTLEALKYTFDTKELREMYINLLATSMNIETVTLSHPAYVDIIKQMTPLDAVIFEKASKIRQIPCARISFVFGSNMYSSAMPRLFIPDLLDTEDPFLVSSAVQNLCRLGVITHLDTSVVEEYNYDVFKEHSFVTNQYEVFKKITTEGELIIRMNKEVILINDFGRNFAKACLNN